MPKIEMMYAFVAEGEGPDDEGIVAFDVRGVAWMPLVGADMRRVESLKPIAQSIARQIGKRVKILQFETRKEIEVIEPERRRKPMWSETVADDTECPLCHGKEDKWIYTEHHDINGFSVVLQVTYHNPCGYRYTELRVDDKVVATRSA